MAKRVSQGLDTGKYYGIIFKNTVIIVRRCLTCEDYDLCEECYTQQVENKRHSKDHKMQAILGTAHYGHVVSIIWLTRHLAPKDSGAVVTLTAQNQAQFDTLLLSTESKIVSAAMIVLRVTHLFSAWSISTPRGTSPARTFIPPSVTSAWSTLRCCSSNSTLMSARYVLEQCVRAWHV